MVIAWFSWKDIKHPAAGGAEVVSTKLRENLVKDGHEVHLFTAKYPGSDDQESVSGVKVYRSGGRFSTYIKSRQAFKKLGLKPDLVIDEMNTIPFMADKFSNKSVLLTYQLARQVWFYQMVFPLSVIGYLLEPLYLRLMSKKYQLVLTESQSTKSDLAHYGFDPNIIDVFRVGIELDHAAKLSAKKLGHNLIFLGAFRPMKRPLDAVKAFELARDQNDRLTLTMAGNTSGSYGQKVLGYISKSRHAKAITVKGHVSLKDKSQLLAQADYIIVTSIKEGWGLIVTEANVLGTPAIVYDTDGLRDSVIKDKTGYVVAPDQPAELAKAITSAYNNPNNYETIRQAAFKYSAQFTFENSYLDFKNSINKILL